MQDPAEFLTQIAENNEVFVLFAVEAGSRAWGFPSPDSDFDVRFVYARPMDSYLSLRRPHDVIESTKGDFDLVGWDVHKALALMLNGNHAIREWLRSPIQYVKSTFYAPFLNLAQCTPSHIRLTYSYRSLLHKTIRDYLAPGQDQVLLKKYFYAIRSALVIEWLQTHGGFVPPMRLSELMEQTRISAAVKIEIEELLAKKLVTSELGLGDRLPATDEFIFRHDIKDPLAMAGPPSEELFNDYDAVLRGVLYHSLW